MQSWFPDFNPESNIDSYRFKSMLPFISAIIAEKELL